VDAKQCRSCHTQIYDRYEHVGMGRSFAPTARATPIEGYLSQVQFSHAASGRRYEVLQRGARVFQRRFEIVDGKETNAFELEATHAIGSGHHARTFLHRSERGEFVELPLTWYSQEKQWAMSPGFDKARPPDFTRIIDDRCLFCHNGYPGADGALAAGIDCQRCHGPGGRHIESRGEAGTIVNPAKLDGARQLDVCMQCHLETTSADLPAMVRRFRRTVNSFRPGERLTDYAVQFDDGRAEKFEVVNQAYRMRQSLCFLKSSGRLRCTTCHDPHDVPRGEMAKARHREQCRTCHTTVQVVNHPDLQMSDCVSCHMPRRRTEDVVHVIMTDHKIQRRPSPGNLLRPLKEVHRAGRPALYYPDNLPENEADLYIGMALIATAADRRAGVTRIERQMDHDPEARAVAVLGEAYFADGKHAEAIAAFERALAKDPSLPKARYNLAQAFEAAGQIDRARAAYEQAGDFPEARYALGNLLRRSGDLTEAIRQYRRALALRPTYTDAHINLGSIYADQARFDEALAALEQALRIDPSADEAHNNLGRVFAAKGSVPKALVHLRRALALNAANVTARYNLARVFQSTNAMPAAAAEYRRVLATRPGLVEAHVGLGQALGDMNQIDGAIAEFREALRLQPDHAEAQKSLRLALSIKQGGR
jgi:predicted CXXCH cytochrome family protein